MPDFQNVFEELDGLSGTGTISDLPGKNTGKRILVLFIIDATKSMEGTAIGQVNYALAELFSDMKNFASDNMLNMELAILSFSNSIRWEMKPEDINNCPAIPQINVRPGNTQYGVVYHELNKMLNKNNLLKSTGKQAAPVLVFLTDGAPVDDYKYDLEQLKKNGYFMLANRSAVIMGEGANNPAARAAVAEFTMDEKMVLTTDNTSEIVNTIKLATLHTLKGTAPGDGPEPIPGGVNNSGSQMPTEGPFPDDPTVPTGGPFPDDPSIPTGGPFPDDPTVPTGGPFPDDPTIPTGNPFPDDPTIPTGNPFPDDPTIPSGNPFPDDPTIPTGNPFPDDPTIPTGNPFPDDPTIPTGSPFPDDPSDTTASGNPFPDDSGDPTATGNPFPDDPFAGLEDK